MNGGALSGGGSQYNSQYLQEMLGVVSDGYVSASGIFTQSAGTNNSITCHARRLRKL